MHVSASVAVLLSQLYFVKLNSYKLAAINLHYAATNSLLILTHAHTDIEKLLHWNCKLESDLTHPFSQHSAAPSLPQLNYYFHLMAWRVFLQHTRGK